MVLALAMALAGFASVARSQVITINDGSPYTVTTLPGGGGVATDVADDGLVIDWGALTVDRGESLAVNGAAPSVEIGGGATGAQTGALNVADGGVFHATTGVKVGGSAAGGISGTLTNSGSSVIEGGLDVVSHGSANLAGGTSSIADGVTVNGGGKANFAGGTNNITRNGLNVTGAGSAANVTGGSLAVTGKSTIDHGAVLNVDGGALALNGGVTVDGGGTLNFQGNSNLSAGGAGFSITDGTFTIGNAGTAPANAPSGNITLGASGQLNFNGTRAYGNIIAGSGSINILGNGTTALRGNSSGFTGDTLIKAGTLELQSGGALGGLITVGNGTTFAMTGSSGVNAASGTVHVNAGGTVDIANKSAKSIHALELDGGKLKFSNATIGGADTLLTVDTLDLAGSANTVEIDTLSFDNTDTSSKLLGWDNAAQTTTLLAVGAQTGGGSFTYVPPAGGNTLDIQEGGETVAKATYTGSITHTPTNISLTSTLAEIALVDDKTLTLRPYGDNTLTARITDQGPNGTGELAIDAGTGAITLGDDTSLSPADNHYKGETRVKSGALILGESNALGQAPTGQHTSRLTIERGGTLDLNGKTQTIEKLTVKGADYDPVTHQKTGTPDAILDFNNGNLTVNNGGFSAGELKGGGTLLLTGTGADKTFSVSGDNRKLSVNTTINSGATLQLRGTTSFGSAPSAGSITFAGSDATLAFVRDVFTPPPWIHPGEAQGGLPLQNQLQSATTGDGKVALKDNANIVLVKDNSGFSGNYIIDDTATLQVNVDKGTPGGALNIQNALGAGETSPASNVGATITLGGTLVLNTDAAFTLNNRITPNGNRHGTLQVTTGAGNEFNFSKNISGAIEQDFAGTVELNESVFNLQKGNPAYEPNIQALGDNTNGTGDGPTLVLKSGSVTNVLHSASGPSSIGNEEKIHVHGLTIDGGTLNFGKALGGREKAEAYLDVETLDIKQTGTINVEIDSGVGIDQDYSKYGRNVLLQDDPNSATLLIKIPQTPADTDHVGTAGGIKLTCDGGACAETKYTITDLETGTTAVADATATLRLSVAENADPNYATSGSGLYVAYALDHITIRDHQRLDLYAPDVSHDVLHGKPDSRDLSARLSGGASTHLQIGLADATGNTIPSAEGGYAGRGSRVSMSNLLNDYQGDTKVLYGVNLSTNNNHVLGNTRELYIDADDGASVTLKNTQSIGHLTINETDAASAPHAPGLDLVGTLVITASQHVDANGDPLDHEAVDSGGALNSNMIQGGGALTLSGMNMTARSDAVHNGGSPVNGNDQFTGSINLTGGSKLTVHDVAGIGNAAGAERIYVGSKGANDETSDILLFDGANGADPGYGLTANDAVVLERRLEGDGYVRLVNGSVVQLAKDSDLWGVDQAHGAPVPKWFEGTFQVTNGTRLVAPVNDAYATEDDTTTTPGTVLPGSNPDPFGLGNNAMDGHHASNIVIERGGTVELVNATTTNPNNGSYHFDHGLTGQGDLVINTTTVSKGLSNFSDFTFVDPVGNQFAGTVKMNTEYFELGNASDCHQLNGRCNTYALTNATLETGDGKGKNNYTLVDGGVQNIGGLITHKDSALDFQSSTPAQRNSNAGIHANTLDVRDGGIIKMNPVAFDAPTSSVTAASNNNDYNILEQDDGNVRTKLLDGATVIGSVSHLTLEKGAPADVTNPNSSLGLAEKVGIHQGGVEVAKGAYDYALVSGGDGIYVAHDLTGVELNAGRTLTLAEYVGATGAAADLNAKLTGAGHLNIAAGAGLVSLSNSGNDYSGNTSVSNGTLRTDASGALGPRGNLVIHGAAKTDLNNTRQTISAFDGRENSTLDFKQGSVLEIAAGGTSSGTLTGGDHGAGKLNVNGGTLVVTHSNIGNGFTADTNIALGAVTQLNHLGGLDESVIHDTGTLDLHASGNLANRVDGTGIVDVNGAPDTVVTLSGDNSGFTGAFIVEAQNTLKVASTSTQANFGNPASAEIKIDTTGALLFDAYDGSLGNNIESVTLGGGSVDLVNGANVTLTGDNAKFSGTGANAGFHVENGARLHVSRQQHLGSADVHVRGLVDITTGNNPFNFINQLDGDGTLYVNTGTGRAFAFSPAAAAYAGASPGIHFTGTLELGPGAYALHDDNTLALTYATLKTDAGNVTSVGNGGATAGQSQTIGGLTFDGGTVRFPNLGTPTPFTPARGDDHITTTTLDARGTGVVQTAINRAWIHPDPSDPSDPHFGNPWLLEHDEGQVGTQLVAATTVLGTAGSLVLQDERGNDVSGTDRSIEITRKGRDVATGTYGLRLTTGAGAPPDGLYVNYGLKKLDLHTGETTYFVQRAGYTDLAADMSAYITGAGNLAIDAAQGASRLVSLSNSLNDYRGTTTVERGTLLTRVNHALGNTASLTVNSGATAALQDAALGVINTTQNVGAVHTASGSTLFVDTGSELVIDHTYRTGGTAGGYLAQGTLTGGGKINIKPSELILEGAQTFTGDIHVLPGSALRAINAAETRGNLYNAGTVQVYETASSTLTVDNYIGQNGTLILGAYMGSDTSDTDKLKVKNDVSGATQIRFIQRGGSGARTIHGIQVVEVGGVSTPDAFTIASNSAGYRAGHGSIVGGAYEYRLKQGGNGGASASWYLVSNGQSGHSDPEYRPEVGGYLDNRFRALAMLTDHSLHDRQSHRVPDPADTVRSGWARMDANNTRHTIGHGLKARDREERLHVGLDVLRIAGDDADDGELTVGGMFLSGHSRGEIRSGGPKVKRRTEVNAGGLYATYHANRADQLQGFYADTWFLAGRIKNRVHGENLAAEKQKASGLAASLEVGYGFKLKETANARYFIEPEAQVILGRYRAGSHTEENGTVVSRQSDHSITTRLGVRLTGERKTDNNALYRPFATVNWWHGDASSSMRFDADPVKDELPKDRLELKIGLEGQVTKKLSLWGSIGAQSDFDNYRQGEVQLGLRYRF
ncbi:hypothetical protein AGMMS49545_13410 [Betaproteobacteria bacterium]|nr:hypothetical protein AGMMS49545_13410 [Betaproteobacteria bacterium]GHU42475.1 hypothetical protein AGMMS50289_07260 [Betaproteobacteria bacterium]